MRCKQLIPNLGNRGNSYDVLKQLRVSKIKTPILILSGLAGIEDKVKGLGVGADDYMTKPFHKDELVARIHAIVRRSKGHAQSVIQTGDLMVNLDTKTVEVGGQRVHLTGKEYQMLELLSLRKGTTQVAVKNLHRPDGKATPWAYSTLMNPFDPSPVMAPSAPAHEDAECYDCHKAHASKDNVWVQFYPTLRKLLP
jgi:hypothetical protein